MSTTAIRAPSLANSSAEPRPIPEPAPVIRATLSESFTVPPSSRPAASQDAFVTHPIDIFPAKAEFQQYFFGMLAQFRRHRGAVLNLLVYNDWIAGDLNFAGSRMLQFAD